MNHPSPSALKLEHHLHCISCVNQKCMVKSEQGVSCEITSCPSLCGAVFHSCKGDEHQLLCPFKRVPCLNGNYGCPAMLLRNEIPAHLDVCPAGVVFCVERWNVHPAGLLELEADCELGSVLDKIKHHKDLVLALEDRQALLEALEDIGLEDLAYKDPVIYRERKEIQLTLSLSATQVSGSQLSSSHQLQSAPERSSTEEIVSRINCLNDLSLHKPWNAKAKTARSLTADLDFGSSISYFERNSEAEQGRDLLRGLNSHESVQKGLECTTPGDDENCSSLSCSYESGALKSIDLLCENTASGSLMGATEANDVAKEPVTSQMTSPVSVSQGVAQWALHVVLDDKGELLRHDLWPETMSHHKHFSKDQGQYPLSNGQLDVKPHRSLYRPETEVEDKAVDTLELNWTGQHQMDPISAVLFSYLEKYKEFRGISDTFYVDDYHVDFGTQTFVPCTYPLICGQSFRRDEYSSHYRNIHCDFHPNFRDRIESHCPLALYGCRFSQQRLYPATQGARVVHHKHLKAFAIQPYINAGPATNSQSDWFSGLPIEVLRHIAGFLDSFSLCQLSLVSRTMREVCSSLLPLRGIVELQWERGHFPGRPHNLRWRVKNKVWRFSGAFTPVSSWGFVDVPCMSDHIRNCPFFNRAEARTEPVPLTAMTTEQDRLSILHCHRALRHISA